MARKESPGPRCSNGLPAAARIRLAAASLMARTARSAIRTVTATAALAASATVIALDARGEEGSPAADRPEAPAVRGQPSPASPGPDQDAGSGAAGAVDLQRQLNDLRSDLLDEREKRIRRQQGFDRLVILVLGIAIGIGGIWANHQIRVVRAQRGIGADAPRSALSRAAPHRLLAGRTFRPVSLLGPAGPETGPGSETGLVPDSARLDTALAADAWIWSGELRDFAVDEAAERQRHEEAIADCTEAIRLDPDVPQIYLERGDARAGLGSHEEAIEDYDRAIRLDPDDAAAYFGRSEAKAELGRYDEAIEDFDRGVRLEPDMAPASEGR